MRAGDPGWETRVDRRRGDALGGSALCAATPRHPHAPGGGARVLAPPEVGDRLAWTRVALPASDHHPYLDLGPIRRDAITREPRSRERQAFGAARRLPATEPSSHGTPATAQPRAPAARTPPGCQADGSWRARRQRQVRDHRRPLSHPYVAHRPTPRKRPKRGWSRAVRPQRAICTHRNAMDASPPPRARRLSPRAPARTGRLPPPT